MLHRTGRDFREATTLEDRNYGGRMQPAHADAILTRDEVAGWLKLRPRQVERLGIPCIDLGRKTKRYLAQDVIAWLQAKRVERGRQSARSSLRRTPD